MSKGFAAGSIEQLPDILRLHGTRQQALAKKWQPNGNRINARWRSRNTIRAIY
jgi:hypothetical protein